MTVRPCAIRAFFKSYLYGGECAASGAAVGEKFNLCG